MISHSSNHKVVDASPEDTRGLGAPLPSVMASPVDIAYVEAAYVLPAPGEGQALAQQDATPGQELGRQLTVRGCILGLIIGSLMSIIVLKLSLTTGVIPSLNISSGILGFVGLRSYVGAAVRVLGSVMETSPQENTVVQTFAVAMSTCSFLLGFGSYYLGMSETIAAQAGGTAAQIAEFVNPTYANIVAYAFATLFTGLFVLVALRRKMVVELKLTYPSGTATASMINGFFTTEGQETAKRQFSAFSQWFSVTFLYDMFTWFFTGVNGRCGMGSWPTLGIKAYEQTFYFNLGAVNYIGVGMLCPDIVNYSMLVGGVLSWGLLWPWITSKAGLWFPAGREGSGLHGVLGYQVFFMIALIIGEGVTLMAVQVFRAVQRRRSKRGASDDASDDSSTEGASKRRELERIFESPIVPAFSGPMKWLKEGHVWAIAYLACAALGTSVVPLLFPAPWYTVLAAYVVVPLFAFPNSYIAGQSDWDMSSTFGKLAIFAFAAWGANDAEGIIAGLATCGIVLCGTSQACTLMQDFKTGYLTGSSPRAMLLSQILGTIAGALVTPGIFFMFYSAFPVGDPNGLYRAPYAVVYRSMAILGTEGFSALPDNCLLICGIFFAMAVVLTLVREFVPDAAGKDSWATWVVLNFVPLPAVMAIPMYIGAWLPLNACIGSVVRFVWNRRDKAGCEALLVSVASGIIAGDGLWALPSAILALAGVNPPVCMSFA